MMSRQTTFAAINIAIVAILIAASTGAPRAQMPSDAMGIPIPTTIVLAKPAPGETYESRPVITVGVGSTTYRFILKDGYTNHIYVKWASIWEQVRQSSPNLVAAGLDAEKFGQVEPGGTVTISGMYTPEQRNFEVLTVDFGESRFQKDQRHY